MHIILKNIKKGFVKLKVEVADDLWTLSQIINTGDTVKARTTRKIKLDTDGKGTTVKKTIILKLRVNKIEWGDSQLRINGAVLEGPEDVPRGSSHTIKAEPQTELTLEKEYWPNYQLKQLDEAAADKGKQILIVVFDREEALFATLTKYGYKLLAELKGDVQKKRIEVKVQKNFFKQIGEHVEQYHERIKPTHIILASPSFWKEELLKQWNPGDLKKKIVQASCSSARRNAISEVIKRPETKAALQAQRVAEETKLVESVFERIAKEGAVSYGFEQVKAAAHAAAISELLISDGAMKKAREEERIAQVEFLLKTVDKSKGAVHIISSAHDAGTRLDGLGGVAALLRYKLQ